MEQEINNYGLCATCSIELHEPLSDLRLMYCKPCQKSDWRTNWYMNLVEREDIGWSQAKDFARIINIFKDIYPFPYNTMNDKIPPSRNPEFSTLNTEIKPEHQYLADKYKDL